MDAFLELRKLARQRRKNVIAQAEEECASAMDRIAELERDICGTLPSKRRTLSACIEQSLPRDTTFTQSEIMAALQVLDSKRVWSKPAVANHLPS